jgi:hypothetical protein
MTAHWLSRTGLFLMLLSVGLLTGCVERRYTVITDPPMAMVLENGRPIGQSPVNRSFDYYGIYKLTLMGDGYQTVSIDQDITAPWYEYPPFDFFVENLLPWWIRDYHVFKYTLQRTVNVPNEQSRDRAMELREKAAPLAVPLPEGPQPKKLVQPPQ